ncbi:MAG: metal-dependent transcriptional regulator [Nitriliruptorales bacterium]
MVEIQVTTQEYLETIYELEEEGIPPLRARIVERLGLSAPTVSETVARLEDEGYLHVGEDRVIRLTQQGRKLATNIVRRHRLAERLLTDVIGVAWSEAHHEASKWEHVISDAVEEKIIALLGDPGACPHGNPIPGSANIIHHPEVAVWDVEGGEVEVVRISEELELDDDVLVLMEACGFIPGRRGRIMEKTDAGVRVAGSIGEGVLPILAARLTYVVPSQQPDGG